MNISLSLKPCQAVFSGLSISRLAKYELNNEVDIKQIRRDNMLFLIGKGTRAAFAHNVGTDPAYISQILSSKTKADVGNGLARAIEVAYKLPFGWMDQIHDGATDAVVASFEWTYKNANDEGKKFLRGAIDSALVFVKTKEAGHKKA